LQRRLGPLFETLLADPVHPRTVVVVPSLSLDEDVLAKVVGIEHYEERLLCMLMLLRMPRTTLVYITSRPVQRSIIEYYLHLLPGVPYAHARRRLTMISCNDASSSSLTSKILRRPRLVRRIRRAIAHPALGHLTVFNSTPLERTLAVRLGLPLYACDPQLAPLGSKSGSRQIFREAGVDLPAGFEDLRDADDIAEALLELKREHPEMRRAAVKLNEGVSGDGNALFSFEGWDERLPGRGRVRRQLQELLRYEASDESWPTFESKFEEMGGVVEGWLDGEGKRSPSFQGRIDPLGRVQAISTHDQLMGGPNGQVFKGATFPAIEDYRLDVQDAGLRISEVLARRGALGRFSVDFVSLPTDEGWRHYAIEINLRKGGTTHPYLMLQYLSDGDYDPETGLYRTPNGQERYYLASDNLVDERYLGLDTDDLIDIAVCNRLHYHAGSQTGVVFHLLGALSTFGKLGVVSVGASPDEAEAGYERTVEVLDRTL
jgi:hypothetical protein